MSEQLSVAIIARDAAGQIESCLKSVAFADDIVVVDSGSTDSTIDIARHHRARVIHKEWLGFGNQKRFAVTQAHHDWVLCIDVDERVTDELRQSITSALASPRFRAFRMARRNRFMGRWLRHGEGYPDWSLRLFDRRTASWSEDNIHEKVVTDVAVGALTGDLLHQSETTIADYLAKQNNYTTLQAQKLFNSGKRASSMKMFFNPLFRFIKFYFLRLGILDGIPGFVHISIGCFNTFVKYAKLRELQRREHR